MIDIFESLGHLVIGYHGFIKKGTKYTQCKGNHNSMTTKHIQNVFVQWKKEEVIRILMKKFPYELVEIIIKYK